MQNLLFSILVGSILGIIISKMNTRKRLKDEFEEMLFNFIDTYNFFAKYLDKDIEIADIYDEIKENERVFKPAEINSPFVRINILNRTIPAFNTKQLRVFLQSSGNCIIDIEKRFEEKFNFKYDNENETYKDFLTKLVELRRICMCMDE